MSDPLAPQPKQVVPSGASPTNVESSLRKKVSFIKTIAAAQPVRFGKDGQYVVQFRVPQGQDRRYSSFGQFETDDPELIKGLRELQAKGRCGIIERK